MAQDLNKDIRFLKKMKGLITAHINTPDITKIEYAAQMCEDWIRELESEKEKIKLNERKK